MPKSNSNTVEFTPIETGDLSEIPPDLPKGSWLAQCEVKKSATREDKYPMLILTWKTLEANDDENENSVGGSTSDFLTFFPKGHKGEKMSKLRLKALCDALDIELPAVTSIKSWDDLSDLVDALDGLKATIYTNVETVKGGDNAGQQRTTVRYSPPGALSTRKPADADDDEEEEEEEEEEAPPPKKSKTVEKTSKKSSKK